MATYDETSDVESASLLVEETSLRSSRRLGITRFSCQQKWILPVLALVLAVAALLFGFLRQKVIARAVETEAFFEPLPSAELSLFCFMVIQPPPSYEYDLVQYLYNNSLSIFQCEEWAVFSDRWEDPIAFGIDSKNQTVKSIPIPGPEAYRGTYKGAPMLINAQVFYRAWENVVNSGIYRKHNFSIKVDPDSVFIPERLKGLLQDQGKLHTPDKVPGRFFTNCWKWNPLGTMQGPLEVLSTAAVETFGQRKEECYWAGKKYQPEDLSMRNCLDQLGTWKLPLYGAMYDASGCPQPNLPSWIDCRVPKWAVYHPLKEVDAYKSCWSMIEAQDWNASKP